MATDRASSGPVCRTAIRSPGEGVRRIAGMVGVVDDARSVAIPPPGPCAGSWSNRRLVAGGLRLPVRLGILCERSPWGDPHLGYGGAEFMGAVRADVAAAADSGLPVEGSPVLVVRCSGDSCGSSDSAGPGWSS